MVTLINYILQITPNEVYIDNYTTHVLDGSHALDLVQKKSYIMYWCPEWLSTEKYNELLQNSLYTMKGRSNRFERS